MRSAPEPYRCRECGATSYGRLTHRDSRGVMSYSGLYRCSGCAMTFSSLREWRIGGHSLPGVERPAGVAAASPSGPAADGA